MVELMEEVSTGPFLISKKKFDWERVAQAVRERRVELDLTQEEARTKAGVANQFWSHLENGHLGPRIKIRSAAGVERALRWKRGSFESLLFDGVTPTSLDEEPTIEFLGETNRELVAAIEDLRERVSELESFCDVLRNALSVLHRGLRA